MPDNLSPFAIVSLREGGLMMGFGKVQGRFSMKASTLQDRSSLLSKP
ncbi:hypothetical protein QUA05_21460 [Microcoleus sp. SVA1_A1]